MNLLFVLVYSLSFVLIGEVVTSIHPIVATFMTYFFTGILFNIIHVRKLGTVIKRYLDNKKLFHLINITTLINTLFLFLSLIYVTPLVYVVIFFGTVPFIHSVFNRKDKKQKTFNFIISILCIMLGILLSASNYTNTTIGIIIIIISSFFAVVYMESSSLLGKNTGMSASEIMAMRFYYVIILCGLYSIYIKGFNGIHVEEIGLIILSSITGSIIPLFILQKSIAKNGTNKTSQVFPFIPVAVIVMLLIKGENYSILKLFIVGLVSLLMFVQNKKLN